MPVLLILCFFARCDDLVQSYYFVGQDGILRPIGNRPYNFLHSSRRITNPPQVTNLPHMIRINFAAKPRCATADPSLRSK